MIPVRVLLKNFLCYAETEGGQPIEFDFEGSPLWSISGDNGAGKSAIFDAITYALFGEHRGGAQEDSRLIRKGADRCETTFEFRLDGQLYKVRRTVGRPRGRARRQEPKTWQAFQFDPTIDDWRLIKETERVAQLDQWVQQKLGFNYNTFVSSVMLRQGESDRLISAKPKERFEILSGLLDLEPYKRLETAANDRMKDARRQAEDLEKRLVSIPAATQEEIEKAEAELRENEHALEVVRNEAAQVELLVNEASRHAKLQNDLSSVERAFTEKENFLRDDGRIRGEYQEWKQLSDALPKIRLAAKDLQKASKQVVEGQQVRSEAFAIDLGEQERARAAAAEAEHRAEEQLKALHNRDDELTAVLPPLNEVLRCRHDLTAREQKRAEQGRLNEWEIRITRLQEALGAQQEEKRRTDEVRERAMSTVAQAKAALQQAQSQLTTRQAAQKEAVCSRCGQPVDPQHIQRELEEAEQTVKTAQQVVETSAQSLQAAERHVKDAASRVEDLNQKLPQLHQSLALAKQAEDEWQDAKEKLQNAINAADQVPTDLLSVVVAGSLADADTLLRRLNTELKAVKDSLKRAEDDRKRASRNKSNAQNAYQQALLDLERLQAEAKRLDDGAEALRKQAEVRLDDVDPHWRERTLAQDLPFISALEERCVSLAGIEKQFSALQQAATDCERLKTQLEEIKRNIGSVRPEHRISESEASKRAEQVKNHAKELQRRRDDSFQTLRSLKDKQQERQKLERDAVAAQRQRRLYSRLAELLGRNGLQSYLLDEAVRGIDHLANETLTRISGGQLRLHIKRGEEEIAIRATDLAFSEESLDVKFLSGSQKFRVSVALAAGIGQYAGRGVGSVRSLIIDEGFGSLDLQGRQEMIDELRNLAQFMDRIIIVSHQEDFQDRMLFPTGYVLRKVNQRTQVERFV